MELEQVTRRDNPDPNPARPRKLRVWAVRLGALFLLAAWAHYACPRWFGVNVTRLSPEKLRASWGGFHGVNITPEFSLSELGTQFLPTSFLRTKRLQHDDDILYPELSHLDAVWMFDAETVLSVSSGLIAAIMVVNPRLSEAEDRVYAVMKKSGGISPDWDGVTRMAAEGYVYLGWVVRNEDEARALREALRDRSAVDFSADLATPHGTLRRIRIGVEEEFVSDPNDETALTEMRKQIPVMFESLNAKEGHPMDTMWVLYLDGHVEEIRFGERFPATQVMVDLFPPPTTD